MQISTIGKEKKICQNNPELTQILEFADKDIKAVIITIIHMFKMLEKKLWIVKEVKDIRKMQIELLEMKTMSEVKNILGRTNVSSDITEEKSNESEDIGIETILNET